MAKDSEIVKVWKTGNSKVISLNSKTPIHAKFIRTVKDNGQIILTPLKHHNRYINHSKKSRQYINNFLKHESTTSPVGKERWWKYV